MLERKRDKCLRLAKEVQEIFRAHGCSERMLEEIAFFPDSYDEFDYDFEIEGLENLIGRERADGLKILEGSWGDYGKEGSIIPYIEYPD